MRSHAETHSTMAIFGKGATGTVTVATKEARFVRAESTSVFPAKAWHPREIIRSSIPKQPSAQRANKSHSSRKNHQRRSRIAKRYVLAPGNRLRGDVSDGIMLQQPKKAALTGHWHPAMSPSVLGKHGGHC